VVRGGLHYAFIINLGLVAFIRIELLIKKLKELKVIENNYAE